MKVIISLFMIICSMNSAWADEFKINFAKDLIEAYSQPLSEADAPELQKNNHQLTVEIKQTRTDPASTSSETEPTKKNQQDQLQPEKDSESLVLLKKPRQTLPVTKPLQMLGMNGFTQLTSLAADPNLGFYNNQINNQNQGYDEFLGEMHDELRFLVGEEVYGKMAWAYVDLKRLDNWIYETTNQLTLFAQPTLAGSQGIVGLSNQLKADLFFLRLMRSDAGRLESLQQGSQVNALPSQADPLSSGQIGQLVVADTALEGKFFGILKYLTILNFVYLILVVITLIYTARFFRFVVRQQ